MLQLNDLPAGIHLQKAPQEWCLVANNRSTNNRWNLLFHAVGLGYILYLEIVLLLGCFNEYTPADSYGLSVLLYGLQGILFFWIVVEMIRAIKRLLDREEKVLKIQLQPQGFVIAVGNGNRWKTQAYALPTVQEVYYNRGAHQKGTDLGASLLDIQQAIFVRQSQTQPIAWGGFLAEEQTAFLAVLLQECYGKGNAATYL